MLSDDTLTEARRLMTICNACRYCEGICAVFPAMELRSEFSNPDLIYLANVCHNCRSCYHGCQFAPPHEYAVNVPKTFEEIRMETYREFTLPVGMFGLLSQSAVLVALIVLMFVLYLACAVLFYGNEQALFGVSIGEGAFYRVIPYTVMIVPPAVILTLVAGVFVIGYYRFLSHITHEQDQGWEDYLSACADVLRLTFLKGGGPGCSYPSDLPGHERRYLHHFVFYGFILCFAASVVAAIYDHQLGQSAPYPLFSLPVGLGFSGGVMIVFGTTGMLLQRRHRDMRLSGGDMSNMDLSFIWLLKLISLTGIALLFLRESAVMGVLLILHLGLVYGLFVTMPYGKFVHTIFRFAALVKFELERQT